MSHRGLKGVVAFLGVMGRLGSGGALVLFLGLLLAAPGAAQRVELRGEGGQDTDAWLASILDDDYLLVTRDTLVAEGDTLQGPVLVLGATLRLSGVVDGDLWTVRGNLFLRPGAVVTGEVRNVAGGFYPSERAEVVGPLVNLPNAPYRLERTDEGYLITGELAALRLELPGAYGFAVPTYNRVEGVGLRWGAGLGLPRIGPVKPWLRGWGGWRTGPGEPMGGGTLSLERDRTVLAGGWERHTATQDAWIREEPMNSLSFLWNGKDRRFYYDAERAWVGVDRVLERHVRTTTASLRVQVEDATTMAAGTPWTLFGEVRPDSNLAVSPGRITSAVLEASTDWETLTSAVELSGLVEVAGEELDGVHTFARWVLHGAVAVPGLADHTLEVEARAQAPFPGTDSLPKQRWSFLGDSPVLYTFPLAAFPGDRLAFVKTEYTIPLPRPVLPLFLGRPRIQLIHTVGKAWSHDFDPGIQQNVGASLRFNWARVRVMTNPDELDDTEVSVGLFIPAGGYPWEQAREGR